MPIDFKDSIIVFCDGACSGNPGPGGWAAVIAGSDGKVRELGGGASSTTNNRMELSAAISALAVVANSNSKGEKVLMFTDSVYVIRGITQWIFGWRKNGWKTSEGKEVSNQDLWEDLSSLVGKIKKEFSLEWHYVRGHTGVPGNERCDEIAVSFTRGSSLHLYNGPLIKYGIAIFDLPEDTGLPEMKEREPKAAPYSYLSLHGGTPMRHATWAECERRVKGQSGAKFKKATSSQDEIEILKSWGVDPSKLK